MFIGFRELALKKLEKRSHTIKPQSMKCRPICYESAYTFSTVDPLAGREEVTLPLDERLMKYP